MEDRHIYEGWCVSDFIEALTPTFETIMNGNSWQTPFGTKDELKKWCIDQQPYYKKYIPEVYKHFLKLSGL